MAQVTITELQTDVDYPLALCGPPNESRTPRSHRPGQVHLSAIYRDLWDQLPQKMRECAPEDLAFYGAGGWLWEWVFSRAYADSYAAGDMVRPDEFELDDIVGSPDGLKFMPEYRLLEFKATWRSMRKLDQYEKYFWLHKVQAAGYCMLTGAREVEMHYFFVCGDWAPAIPRVRVLLLTFGDREVVENWQMIRSHKIRMEER